MICIGKTKCTSKKGLLTREECKATYTSVVLKRVAWVQNRKLIFVYHVLKQSKVCACVGSIKEILFYSL